MIYDVAQSGAMGDIKQVEQTKLYDFMQYYSFIKSQQKYNDLSAARMAAQNKG